MHGKLLYSYVTTAAVITHMSQRQVCEKAFCYALHLPRTTWMRYFKDGKGRKKAKMRTKNVPGTYCDRVSLGGSPYYNGKSGMVHAIIFLFTCVYMRVCLCVFLI